MSANQEKSGGGLKGFVDKAQDMMGGVVGKASAATAGSSSGEVFVANAAIGDRYEIEAASVALKRSGTPGVIAFAQMMIEHHLTSQHQLQSALASSEVRSQFPTLTEPAKLDERRQGMVDNLHAAADDDFDARYLEQQKMAHEETRMLLAGYVEQGDNPQLRSLALGALPMVERHLKAVGQIGVH